MDCLGLSPGNLAHTLGRPSCRSREKDPFAGTFKGGDDGLRRHGLSGTGAAGDDDDFLAKGFLDSLRLDVVVGHAGLLLEFGKVCFTRLAFFGKQRLNPAGNIHLGPVEVPKIKHPAIKDDIGIIFGQHVVNDTANHIRFHGQDSL